MENKILEFVSEFNHKLFESNSHYTPYNYLQYKNDGVIESIYLSEICVFDSENDSSEFVVENSVSNLVVSLENTLKNAQKILRKEVKKFIEGMVKDNSILRYELLLKGNYTWELIVGEEFEDLISDNDFTYLFPGCKLWIKGSEKYNLSLPKSLDIGMYCVTRDGEIVKITSDDMPKYPYECFERMATYYEIKEYESKR